MMGRGDFLGGTGQAFFFVDRINGGIATLLGEGSCEGEISLPVSRLPAGVSEGDYLAASFGIDAEMGASAKRDIDSLLRDLGDNP
ncbi:MAG: DUF3006 domain-containing protein [Synergistaceae bacterium]|jgi:hypothetical protein|nr:DUF3006 domain-containing protein [Synergistaceae bacterium]